MWQRSCGSAAALLQAVLDLERVKSLPVVASAVAAGGLAVHALPASVVWLGPVCLGCPAVAGACAWARRGLWAHLLGHASCRVTQCSRGFRPRAKRRRAARLLARRI